jgi:hypothetical protein
VPATPSPNATVAPTPTPNVYCTQDVFQCPDGSYVSRQPPACQFAPCPTSTPTPSPNATVTPSPTPQACGTLGAACCTGGTCNGTYLACSGSNVCISCGGFGQGCCPGAICQNTSLTCTTNGSQGLGCWAASCASFCASGTNGSVGYVNVTFTSCQSATFYNQCSGNNTLVSYSCNGTSTGYYSNTTACTYGCSNGQCLPQPTPTPGPGCNDTDGPGTQFYINYTTQGTATGPFGSISGTVSGYADACQTNSTVLVEYYCTSLNTSGYVLNTTYDCATANMTCGTGHCQ